MRRLESFMQLFVPDEPDACDLSFFLGSNVVVLPSILESSLSRLVVDDEVLG